MLNIAKRSLVLFFSAPWPSTPSPALFPSTLLPTPPAAALAADGEIKVGYSKTAANQPALAAKPWLNTSLSVDQRVDLLLAAMTPAQKWNYSAKPGVSPAFRHSAYPP
ncbi:hypothetical protein ACQ86N_21950 [Puia sp. P3]|uniref:hypothetical protein n=1 Tax=Puia sp. P3 TaxID=3423952 RepID=UPI003D672F87